MRERAGGGQERSPLVPEQSSETSTAAAEEHTFRRALAQAMANSMAEHGNSNGNPTGAAGDDGSGPTTAVAPQRRSSDDAGSVAEGAGVFVRNEAGGGGGGGGGGDGPGGESNAWACRACTFMNDRTVSSNCQICLTPIPPEERPPDDTYRDTLIGGDAGPQRRPASTTERLLAAAEATRCRLLEAEGRGVSTSGGGSGGRTSSDDNDDLDSGVAMSDAAAGSAIGALGAGMLSALTTGSRPQQVFASMVQGAVVGGVAGAAIGTGFRQESARERARMENLFEHDGGTGSGEVHGGGDPLAEDPGQPRTRRQVSIVAAPVRRRRVSRDMEMMLLAQQVQEMGLSEEAERALIEDAAAATAAGHRPMLVTRWRGLREGFPTSGRRGARPASAASMAALPEEVLTAASLGHLSEDGRQCCICLERFGEGEVATRLPCLHLYHAACIQNWLQTSGTCPQCMHRVD